MGICGCGKDADEGEELMVACLVEVLPLGVLYLSKASN